jgi:hypothetical protein
LTAPIERDVRTIKPLAQANRLSFSWADRRVANPCGELAVLALGYTPEVAVAAVGYTPVVAVAVAVHCYTPLTMPWR